MDTGINMDNTSNDTSIKTIENKKTVKVYDFVGLYRYTAQMVLIYLVFAASVWGLAYGNSTNKDVWLVLLSTITGIGLPAPKISRKLKYLEN